MTRVTISLVSHTNVGKTTLARTLLRRDVGEVLDHAHVTDVSEPHQLIEAGGHELVLWDTPGFGDSARLARRLRTEAQPLGWFLHRIWDRVTDRPLWCSQQAIRNVQEDADVVLYLVSASEHPEDAGYVPHEMAILEWLAKPVLVLVNQSGGPLAEQGDARGAQADPVGAWREALQEYTLVQDVFDLDAFGCSWLQELTLFERVGALVPDESRAAADILVAALRARSEGAFSDALDAITEHVVAAAADREQLPVRRPSRVDKERASAALAGRAAEGGRELGEQLLDLQGLEGRAATEIRERLADFEFSGPPPQDVKRNAFIGGAVGGALSGLTADVLSGGLTLGGGLIAGTLLGALGAAGISHGIELVRGDAAPELCWSDEFLDGLVRSSLLLYLTIAHFGRGRGRYRQLEQPQYWHELIERTWDRGARVGASPWQDPDPAALRAKLRPELERVVRELLER